jgi:hypothetical protein
MKTIIIIAALIFQPIFFYVFAQNETSSDTLGTRKDTTRIVLGKKEIKIVDTEEGTDIKVREKSTRPEQDTNNCNIYKEYHKEHKYRSGFSGHWAGIEFGLNNYLTKDHSMSLNGDDEFMSLNTDRSINFNLNFFQHSIALIGKNFGLVTGLGFEFNNYFFENNNSIIKNSQGVIVSRTYDSIHLDKSKLTTSYLTVPVLFEWQFPASAHRSERLRIAVGVIGGLKLESHTKVVYKENDKVQKNKNRDDFNINSLRYGFTGRVGYNKVNLYVDYYPVSLFEKNKGAELYPISIGLSFSMVN